MTDHLNGATYYMEEYYDYDNNRAHLIFYGAQDGNFDDSAYHQLEFFDSEQKWIWIGDADTEQDNDLTNCSMVSTLATNVTAFDGAILETDGHIARPSQWFRFDDNSNAQFIGFANIRGIDAQVWQGEWNMYEKIRKQYKFIVNSSLTFYFSKPGWNISYAYDYNNDVVPLRAYFDGYYVIYLYDQSSKSWQTNGTNITFQFSYDYIAYVPGEIDEDKFEIPDNWRTQCTLDDDYCIDKTNLQTQDVCDDGEDIPTLPQRFKAVVEANILNKNRTWLMEEYYDYNASKAKRSFKYLNYLYTVFEDFSNSQDERWVYIQDTSDLDSVISCNLYSYSDSQGSSGIFSSQDSTTGKLVSSNEWFQFGSEFGEIYLGEDYYLPNGVRGIYKSRAWYRNIILNYYNSTTQYNRTYNYDLIYYFSPKNWTFYGKNQGNGEIPLRARIDGQHNYDYGNGTVIISPFEHYYDYVAFATGDAAFDGDDVFNFYNNMPNWIDQCDVSSYCNIYPDAKVCSDSAGPPLPDLSDSFTFVAEINDATNNKSYLLQEYYDYYGNRAHIAYYYNKKYSQHGYHQLELPDSRQRWIWIGDASDTSTSLPMCSMSLTKFELTGDDLSVQLQNGHIARPSNWCVIFFFWYF